MEHQAARAREFYAAANRAFPTVDARSLVPAEIMGRIYRALLEEIAAQRFRVFDARITVPTRRKVAIAVRCWAAARFKRNGLAA
jgi:15-cis-phytoene synthase